MVNPIIIEVVHKDTHTEIRSLNVDQLETELTKRGKAITDVNKDALLREWNYKPEHLDVIFGRKAKIEKDLRSNKGVNGILVSEPL